MLDRGCEWGNGDLSWWWWRVHGSEGKCCEPNTSIVSSTIEIVVNLIWNSWWLSINLTVYLGIWWICNSSFLRIVVPLPGHHESHDVNIYECRAASFRILSRFFTFELIELTSLSMAWPVWTAKADRTSEDEVARICHVSFLCSSLTVEIIHRKKIDLTIYFGSYAKIVYIIDSA